MAAPRSCTWRKYLLVQLICITVLFIAYTANSTFLETEVKTCNLASENESQSTFGTSCGHQSLKVDTAHVRPRRGWSTTIRQLRSQAAANSGEYAHAWRATFRNVSDYYDRGIVLVLSTDGTAEFTNIQDAIDHPVSDFNTKRESTIDVTSCGIHEEKVIIPATKTLRYSTRQGEGRNRINISWLATATSAGTLMSASAIVELCDHFIVRDTSFRSTAVAPAPNITNVQPAAIRISGDKAFLLRCNSYSSRDTLHDHRGRRYYFKCFLEGSEDLIFGAAPSLFERCWLNSIAHRDGGALIAQGKDFPGSIIRPSGFSFLHYHIKGNGMPYLGRAWRHYSTVVYSHCQIDANIRPVGHYEWGLREREGAVFLGRYEFTG